MTVLDYISMWKKIYIKSTSYNLVNVYQTFNKMVVKYGYIKAVAITYPDFFCNLPHFLYDDSSEFHYIANVTESLGFHFTSLYDAYAYAKDGTVAYRCIFEDPKEFLSLHTSLDEHRDYLSYLHDKKANDKIQMLMNYKKYGEF